MCAWTVSKTGVCGSSLSRRCQLTDSFMPPCAKTSLSRACWGVREDEPHLYSFTFTANNSLPAPFSVIQLIVLYGSIQLHPTGILTQLPHSSTRKGSIKVSHSFSAWHFQRVLISCVLRFEIEKITAANHDYGSVIKPQYFCEQDEMCCSTSWSPFSGLISPF